MRKEMPCLDANDVVRFLEGNATTADEDHIDACEDCRALVTELGRAMDVPPEVTADPSPRTSLRAAGSGDASLRGAGSNDASLREYETSSPDYDAAFHEVSSWELASGAEIVALGDKVGRYVVLDAIGAGAMGVVYRAYDPELDRDVALKLLRVLGSKARGDGAGAQRGDGAGRADSAARGDKARARLVREAQSLAKVAHPNVVAVFDASSFGDHVYVAMELVEGADLATWIDTPATGSARSWREITRAFVAAGRGLAAAHAAGVIHRDVKPANILVGDDGRVRMTDFGLASSVDETDPDAIVGTPAFMAPEVKRGEQADERSDQYSFAASLVDALRDRSTPEHVDDERSSLRSTTQRPSRTVPRAVRHVTDRALSPSPRDRYAGATPGEGMTEMVDALERALVSTSRRVLPYAALAAVIIVGGSAAYLATRSADGAACPAPESGLVGVWDAVKKNDMRAAFMATKYPLAAEQYARAAASIDTFANAWTAAYGESCAATNVRHEQSAELFDLRMQCLQGERARLAVATDMFAHADQRLVARAIAASDIGVERLARCSDAAMLRSGSPIFTNPVSQERDLAATALLAFVESVSLRGKFEPAMAGARIVMSEAIAVGDKRLEADAQRSLGETQWRAGKYADAQATLQLAIDAAKRAGGADLEAGALLDLVAVLIEDGKYPEAMQVSRIAEATVRAAHDDLHLANLLGNRGAIHYLQEDYKAARADYEQARTLFEKLYGPNDRHVGQTVMNLALTASEIEDIDPLPLYAQAIGILEKSLGPHHPEVALARNNRAVALANAKRHPEALKELDEVLAMRIEVLGVDHRDTIGTFMTMGAVVADAGDHAAALAHYQQVLARYTGTMRADHPLLAHASTGVGRALVGLHRDAEAIAPLEHAISIYDKEKLDIDMAADARYSLAQALWNTGGDKARARTLAIAAYAATVEESRSADLHAAITTWLTAHGGVP